MTCANRLKLVVQLRRFVVPEGSRRPNLASQCLGLALRQLPDAWHHRHGYQLLLAESFHDPAIHQGTLYKVTNWSPQRPPLQRPAQPQRRLQPSRRPAKPQEPPSLC